MQAQHVGFEGRKQERELQREWRDKQRTLEDELQPKPEPHTFAARMERREQAASRVRGMRIAPHCRRSLDFAFFFSFCFCFCFSSVFVLCSFRFFAIELTVDTLNIMIIENVFAVGGYGRVGVLGMRWSKWAITISLATVAICN